MTISAEIQRVTKVVDWLIFEGQAANRKDLAEKLGYKESSLSQILTGKVKLSYKFIKNLSKFDSRINEEWILSGADQMLIDADQAKIYTVPAIKNMETRPRIPMTVAAGTLTGFADSVYLKDCQQIPIIKALPNYDYTMIVKGDSMEPKFEGGDEIAIRKVNDIIEWGKPYVLDTRDGAVLKRLYESGDDYRCVSYNNEYPDFTVNKGDVLGVYKVVGLIRI